MHIHILIYTDIHTYMCTLSTPIKEFSREGALTKILARKCNHGLEICVCSCSI